MPVRIFFVNAEGASASAVPRGALRASICGTVARMKNHELGKEDCQGR
jgi:hypothetical protein